MSLEGFVVHEDWQDRADPLTSFDELYSAHYGSLVAYCRRHLGKGGDPEAIAQEAFTRAWTSWDRYTAGRPFWPWLVTIAHRLCIDHRRREMRQSELPATVAIWAEAGVLPEERLELVEEQHHARVALGRLKPGDRRVVELRDIDGWSYEQIARFEGVTVESIRGSLKRARIALRHAYERVTQGALGVLTLEPIRRRRSRATQASARVQLGVAQAPSLLVPLGDALIGAVVLSLSAASVLSPTIATDPVSLPDPTPAHGVSDVQAAYAAASSASGRTWSPRPDGPGTTSDGAEGGSVPSLPGFDQVHTPEDAVFSEFTPSPHYEQDGTVFGVGAGTTGCIQECAVLFRSTDRGASWERLPAVGFAGGRILLPPAFPADDRIFASGPTGLQVSDDGGGRFITVTPFVGPAFLSPRFAQGDERVLVGAAPGWEYRADLGTTTPMTVAPPATNTSPSFSIAFSPDFDVDKAFFIGGSIPVPGNPQASTVFACVERGCGQGVTLPTSAGSPALLMVAGNGRPAALFAWRTDALFVSHDRGVTFRRLTPPAVGAVRSVSTDGTGAVFMLLESAGRSQLFTSVDAGSSWSPTSTSALPGSPRKVEALPGLLIMAPKAEAGGGILCSVDGGASWRRRCA